MTTPPRPGDRIAKLLARAGIASRREIERMIADGRIARDGVAIDTPATVLTSLVGITVDGKPVEAPQAARLFLYHKPTGLLVTERDPAGRPTIYDRLPSGLPRVVPVGRLDLNTEGLLLLTTDGGLKRLLELPSTGIERSYRARCYGPVTQAQLETLIEGVEIDGIRYGSIDANLERRTGANTWVELTLTEGKNREVRRVLEHLGLQVSRLIRTRYGPFVLGDLPPGEVGEVRPHDVVSFAANPTRRDLPQAARAEPWRGAAHAPVLAPTRAATLGRAGAGAPARGRSIASTRGAPAIVPAARGARPSAPQSPRAGLAAVRPTGARDPVPAPARAAPLAPRVAHPADAKRPSPRPDARKPGTHKSNAPAAGRAKPSLTRAPIDAEPIVQPARAARARHFREARAPGGGKIAAPPPPPPRTPSPPRKSGPKRPQRPK